ncbi:cyclic nucleotide gated channel 1 [Prunus dulcis]|uniref:Cyclic nucleotide gated channel 1 n=1 Tax=Prunus dulcis TaxID=3755 RepID=A0A4Y1RMM6_PRUDU|nr:cyclic nucleotide gated channel 1 [Prunus dulcis]
MGEAFWELTGFGVVRTPKLSEWEAGAIPGWVTTLGSCSVSSQKQNRAGLGPKRTISCYGRAGPGRDSSP